MKIYAPQISGSLAINGTSIGNFNNLVSTSSFNQYTSSISTGSLATTGSNTFVGNQTMSGSIIPAVTNTYDLGDISHQFRHLYLSSGSLYINGTKVLGTTGQELQITTDAGQSLKILEAGSDTITLQSADGNITLATSGGGDVILDPTSGIIALKGTTTLYAGNKILSSDGAAIQIGNDLGITGSIVTTGNINGINLTTFSSSVASTLSNQNSATSSYETKGTGIISSSAQLNNTSIENLTVINLTTVNETASVIFSSGSNRFGDFSNDTHQFTGSVQITGSFTLVGSSTATSYNGTINATNDVVSGSSQLTSSYDARYVLSGSITQTTWDNIASKPGGIVSGSAQTIANLPTGTVSGSSQVVNILSSLNTYTASVSTGSLATTGSNTFTGTQTISASLNVSGSTNFGGAFAVNDANMNLTNSSSLNLTSGSGIYVNSPGVISGSISGIGSVTTYSASVSAQLTTLNTYTGSNDTKWSTLSTLTASNAESISQINSVTASLNAATSSYETKGRSIVSGSSQIDVMSTTNIARLATTGSNTFNGNQSITGSISTTTYVGVTKAGANGVGEGPYVVVAQPASSIQYLMQLNASSGLDYWHYNGTAWSTPLKISSSGIITTGVIKGDSGADYPHSFTNTDAANTHWTNRSGRLLTSNGTNWVGDGKDPIMALVSGNNSTVRGNAIALAIHHEGQSDGTYSPMIAFSNKSNSGNYNTTYAAIMGKKTGQANDTNWSQGELHFFAQPAGTYMGDTPNFLLSSTAATFSGTITESSSLRYKENVETIKYGLDKVLQMRGVTYDKKDNGVKELGVIAEEVYDILPEVVLKNEEGEIDSVSYGRIVGVLIEAIKEQQKQIEELKSLIK